MKTEALLTPHMIASLKPAEKEQTIYDAGCPGLALRIQPKGARTWVCWEKTDGQTRRVSLGKVADLNLDAARQIYRLRQVGVTEQPRQSTRLTLQELSTLFLAAKSGVYSPRTLSCMSSYLDSQLLPSFGASPLHRISTPDIAAWFHRYARTRSGGANAALTHFTTIWNWGRSEGHIPSGLPNPARPLRKMARAPRGQMLNTSDLKRLSGVLSRPPTRTRDAAEAVRLILLTGCRSGEILRLRWEDVHQGRLKLSRTKTGPRTVVLSSEAQEALTARRQRRTSDYVFPSPSDPDRPRGSITSAWATIKEKAELPETLRLHDLRHSYASHALLAGESLYLTGKLLGHRATQSTERYAHLDGKTLAKAADEVATAIEAMMEG